MLPFLEFLGRQPDPVIPRDPVMNFCSSEPQ